LRHESASVIPVDGLVQIPIHLAEQDLEPPLGLGRRELVKLLGLLAGAEDGLVVEPVIMVLPPGTVPRIPRTECPVLFSLSALAAINTQRFGQTWDFVPLLIEFSGSGSVIFLYPLIYKQKIRKKPFNFLSSC
jgi:hypothetical protein